VRELRQRGGVRAERVTAAGHDFVTIRKGRPADVGALTDIENRCFRAYYRDHRLAEKDFERSLRDPRTLVLVAANDRDVVGYILGQAPVPAHRQTARVDSLAVLKPWRHHGVARRLLQRFLTMSRGRGCRRVYLEVGVPNEEARALFEQAQFQHYRRLKRYYGGATDAVRLRRVLT